LASVTLPEGLEAINSNVFQGCTALKTITLPASLKTMGYSVFMDCSALETTYCLATTPPTLYADRYTVFERCDDDLVIYVPSASVDSYKSDSMWSYYTSKITAMK